MHNIISKSYTTDESQRKRRGVIRRWYSSTLKEKDKYFKRIRIEH